MKFRVTMKDPDGAYESIQQAAKEQVADLELDEEEKKAILEIRTSRISEAASKWLTYGEYLEIEIDSETGTATVIEAA